MAAARLESVRETLDQELEHAEAEVGRLKSELKAAQQEQKAIRGALVALGSKRVAKPAGKPAPKKEQVLRIVQQLLTENGSMPRADLEALAKEHLSDSGTGLNGFGLRFREALGNARVELLPDDQVAWTTQPAAPTSPPA